MLRSLCFAVAMAASVTGPALAQVPAPTVTLAGTEDGVVTLTPAALAKMPVREQDIRFTSSKGEEKGHYAGVLLWDILATHSGIDTDIKPALRRTILVTASDGHQVAYSVGEIAPDFGNTPVMLSFERDGAALDGLRMVVPGDTRGARNIRNVVSIELR